MPIALRDIRLQPALPQEDQPRIPAAIYAARADAAYQRAGADWLAVYADREHLGNIAHLSGFEPRFEEAFLLLGPGGRRVLLTGNECESYAPVAGLPGLAVLRCQTLSLMGQDRSQNPKLTDVLRAAGLKAGDSIALAGWKYLEPEEGDDPAHAHFVPAAYVRALEQVTGKQGEVRDATAVLMHPETGLRSVIDVHQIASYEWAATHCSAALWQVVSRVCEGDSEYEAIARLPYRGEPLNVHTMFASASAGEPVIGLRSATGRKLRRGDGVTTALGVWGALSSRAGLLDVENDAFLAKAKAYFAGLITWYDTADIGVTGGDLFTAVTAELARAGLNSALNPGHLTGHEEWSHSPVRPGSKERLASGMPFQVDVIPTPMPLGQALNCEDPVVFADAALRAELARHYPAAFARIMARRKLMDETLGVKLKDSILPLSETPLCLPPFWLRPNAVLVRG
ncbi:MAG: Xaa-Pro aminopeptidase [Alphaproteobacteria bacterium]|nr:Xaa-Pro aminopeptidase [Alphaproteobacteria bacterium]